MEKWGFKHILIPPRTPWHNGKVERSHRNDQRYFYDWEHFCSAEELNEKLKAHLEWSNNKTMRTLGRKSPIQLLREKLGALVSTAPRSLSTAPTAPFRGFRAHCHHIFIHFSSFWVISLYNAESIFNFFQKALDKPSAV